MSLAQQCAVDVAGEIIKTVAAVPVTKNLGAVGINRDHEGGFALIDAEERGLFRGPWRDVLDDLAGDLQGGGAGLGGDGSNRRLWLDRVEKCQRQAVM